MTSQQICGICLHGSSEYDDKREFYHHFGYLYCDECYEDLTGKKSVHESKLSDHLDMIADLVNHSKKFNYELKEINLEHTKHSSVDKIFQYNDLIILIGCEENQNNDYGYDAIFKDNYFIKDDYFIEKFQGKKLAFIYWNAGSYAPETGVQLTHRDRLKKLNNIISKLMISEYNSQIKNNINYIFMFFNKDYNYFPQKYRWNLMQ